MRFELTAEGAGTYLGAGQLGSGEQIELRFVEGEMGRLSGTVANTTSLINVSLTGVLASNQITVQFEGSGVGMQAAGTAVLVR